MAGFAADFLGGLNQGLGRGMDMYSQLQQMANQQRQMQMQEQAQQQLMQQREAQGQQDKVNTLVNVAKLKDPKTIKAVLGMIGPGMGFDPESPDFQGLMSSLSSGDAEFLKLIQGAGQEAGVPPNMAALLGQADPNVAAQQLFGYQRGQQNNEMTQTRMEMQLQRLLMQQGQQDLSGQRLGFQQQKHEDRMQGRIPPMGYTPQLSEQGDVRSLVPTAGGPATIPSESERKAAGQFEQALASAQAGEAFMANNAEYMNSLRAQADQTLATGADAVAQGVGALGGAAAGALAAGAAKLPGWAAVSAGAYGGKEIGAGLGSAVARFFTSDKGKEFKTAWAPFVNANLRRETGAAVNEHEWKDAFDRFIPMPGDPPEVQTQKKEARDVALKGIQIGAGRAAASHPEQPAASAKPAPSRTEINNLAQKYRSGQASTQEIDQLKEALRAQGLNVR